MGLITSSHPLANSIAFIH